MSSRGNRIEREDRRFHEVAVDARLVRQPEDASEWPAITFAAIFANGTPVAFETYGTVRDARIHFEHVQVAVLNRVLHVHEADDVQRFRELDVRRRILS